MNCNLYCYDTGRLMGLWRRLNYGKPKRCILVLLPENIITPTLVRYYVIMYYNYVRYRKPWKTSLLCIAGWKLNIYSIDQPQADKQQFRRPDCFISNIVQLFYKLFDVSWN